LKQNKKKGKSKKAEKITLGDKRKKVRLSSHGAIRKKAANSGFAARQRKERRPDSTKGQNGKVVVIAGSEEYTGAAFLCAMSIAILREGNDLVTVVAPEKVAWAINAMSPDIITAKMPGKYLAPKHFRAIAKLVEKADVLVVGPGLGRKPETAKVVRKIASMNIRKVIDADALKMIKLQSVENSILTPHRKEFAVLLKNSKLNEKNFMKKIGSNVILLKGPTDEIYSGSKAIYVSGGNAGMTVGGTGDILAGLCGGFASGSYSLLESAHFASRINKKIGERLVDRIGFGFIASDFLGEIPKMKVELDMNPDEDDG